MDDLITKHPKVFYYLCVCHPLLIVNVVQSELLLYLNTSHIGMYFIRYLHSVHVLYI